MAPVGSPSGADEGAEVIHRLVPGAGIEAAADLEDSYLPPASSHLRVNFISSLDGAIEIDGRSGALGAAADRQVFMAMRAVADVVLVGAGTARAENYGPVRLAPDVEARRQARGQGRRPRMAVVTARGELAPSARLFEGEDPVIVYTTDEVRAVRTDLAEVADLVGCGPGHVELSRVMSDLRGRGAGRVLCEGGPSLVRDLFSMGLVDELCLTISPVLAGPGHLGLDGVWEGPAGRFAMTGLLEGDGLLLARYARMDR